MNLFYINFIFISWFLTCTHNISSPFSLQRCGEKLHYSWSNILEMLRFVVHKVIFFYRFLLARVGRLRHDYPWCIFLSLLISFLSFRSVADASEKELVTLGFQVSKTLLRFSLEIQNLPFLLLYLMVTYIGWVCFVNPIWPDCSAVEPSCHHEWWSFQHTHRLPPRVRPQI